MMSVAKIVSVSVLALIVAGCSGGSGGGGGAGAGAPVESPLFGLAQGAQISVAQTSASYNRGTTALNDVSNSYFFKARDQDAFRLIRYGKPHSGFTPRRNYRVPITLANSAGTIIGTGRATFADPGDASVNESGVTTRTISITDVKLSDSIFGVFSSEDAGSRGNFHDVNAYAGGVAATGAPVSATYTGLFIGDVLAKDFGTTGTKQRIQLPTNLTVNFGGNSFTGTVGSVAAPDMTMTGSIAGTSITGTVTVSSTGLPLANGTTGTLNGGVFGAGANNIAGTVGLTDATGPVRQKLIGAFGTTKN